jgi:hypothetical protein
VIARNAPFDADSLNDKGKDGWELVTVIYDVDRHEWVAYYKRPKETQQMAPPLSS